MAKIEFYKREEESWMLDPKEDFGRRAMTFEVRRDPLTGRVSRILPFRRKLPESRIPPETLELSRNNCPFCPDQILSSTPRFLPEVAPEGKIRRGKAFMFPNAFPYARHNWVVVLSEEHFLYPDQFPTDTLRDGFLVAQDGIGRVEQGMPAFHYSSINWNYLPQAGAGLFHPHFQVVVEDAPTHSHQTVLDALRRYHLQERTMFWEDLLSQEIKHGERYMGHRGNVHFLAAFAPVGIFGEILILFDGRFGIGELTFDDWGNLSEGLTNIFRYFKSRSLESFNLAIFSGSDSRGQSWVYGKLCPRIILPPWNTSDINYFEKLHGEVFCLIPPERFCQEIRPFFGEDEREAA